MFLNFSNVFANDEYFRTLRNEKVNLRQGPSFDYPIKFFYKKKFLPVLVQDKSGNYRLCQLEEKMIKLQPADDTKSDDTSEELKKLVADLTEKVSTLESTLESKLEEANKKIQSTTDTSNTNTQKLMQVIQPLQTSLTSVEKRVAKLE